jgi:membrane protease YdiL (CAAX protease family)
VSCKRCGFFNCDHLEHILYFPNQTKPYARNTVRNMQILIPAIKKLIKLVVVWIVLIFLTHFPLIAIISLINGEFSDELTKTNQSYQMLSAVALLASTILCIRHFVAKEKIKKAFVTFNNVQIAQGFFWGLIIMCTIVLLHISFGLISISFNGFSFDIIILVVYYLLVAITEELLFRGLVFDRLSTLNNTSVLLISSGLFALAHIGNEHVTWIGLITISVSGVLMGLMFQRYGNVSSPIALHFSWNFFQGPIFGYAVSGNKSTSLFKISYLSPDSKMTGGDFGAEGSILLTFVALLAVVYFRKSKS